MSVLAEAAPHSPTVLSFESGFLDGYRGKKRKRNQGPTYLRAYRRGVEARDRDANGGEDVAAVASRGRRR